MLYRESGLIGKTIDKIIEAVGQVYPGWRPTTTQELFMDHKEPLSDNVVELKKAIRENIPSQAVVLTTVVHRPIFENSGIKTVYTYDISPAQLETHQGQSHRKEGNATTWWCDIFNSEMLRTMLAKTAPDVIYLSNILEWERNETKVEDLFITLATDKHINQIMFSTVTGIYIEEKSNLKFIDLLKKSHWKVREYRGTPGEVIRVATKNPA